MIVIQCTLKIDETKFDNNNYTPQQIAEHVVNETDSWLNYEGPYHSIEVMQVLDNGKVVFDRTCEVK